MQKKHKSALLLMALTVLIDFTGFGLVIPVLPFWAEHLGAGPEIIGLLTTVYALAQFIFTPVLGSLSDRYGRKPVIFISLLIEVISLVLTALSWSLPVLAIARFVGGLGASNIGSAQAVVSDVTRPEDRAKSMGLIGAAIGLGFVLGPALGGILSIFGEAVPFYAAAVVAAINALLVLAFLPETRSRRTDAQQTQKGGIIALTGWHNLWRQPTIGRLVAINLLFTIAFTGMESMFALFSQHYFGWTTTQNGYIFTYVGVIVVIMQGGLIRQLVKHWDEQSIMRFGLVLLAIGLVLLGFSTQLGLLLVSMGVISLSDGAITPMISTLLSFASADETQGEIQGLAQGVGGLGRIVGPIVASSLYTFGGPSSPFITGGIICLIALIVAAPRLGIQRKPPTTTPETTHNSAHAELSR